MNSFRQRGFWITGAVLVAGFFIALVVQFAQWSIAADEAEQAAIAETRAAYPDVWWVFDEWTRCSRGDGDYAKNGYLTKEQCDMALAEQGKTRGAQREVQNALQALGSAIENANHSTPVAWPLSIFVSA